MMKTEFIDILKEISPTHSYPTDEQYKRIEHVYTYHPSIRDKKTIVKLWADFGDIIIEDMTSRADAIAEAEQDLQQKEAAYKAALKFYKSVFD